MGRFFLMLLLLALPSVSAQAVTTDRRYTFHATGFEPDRGSAAPPFTSVTGSFTLRFDDAIVGRDTNVGLTAAAINIPIASSIGYNYQGNGRFLLGGFDNEVGSIASDTMTLSSS